jgi:hypothetical protein
MLTPHIGAGMEENCFRGCYLFNLTVVDNGDSVGNLLGSKEIDEMPASRRFF